jgi:hypothetical protein
MSHVIESQEKETQQQHGSSEFSLTMETLEVENRFFFLLPPPQIKQWMVPGVLIGDSIQFYNAGAPIHWECSLATLITKLHWIRVTVFYEVHSLLQWVRPYICVIRGGRRKDYVWPLREDTRKFGQLWETTLWIKDGLLLGDHLKFGWHHFGATTAAVTLKKFEVDCTSNDETVNFCWRTLSLARGWYEK